MPNERFEELADRLEEQFKQGEGEQSVARMEKLLADAEGPVELAAAVKLLRACRDQGRHPELIRLGRALLTNGQHHPSVRRYLAQGLIEQRKLDEALKVLAKAAVDVDAALGHKSPGAPAAMSVNTPYARLALRFEKAEIAGLRGRAYKQLYISGNPTTEEPRSADAWRAESAYRSAYEAAPAENLWHGINLIAIRSHQNRRLRLDSEERDGEADRVAQEILKTLDVKESFGSLSAWDQATRAEAFLALERFGDADKALEDYLRNPELTPFMVTSTARQWRQLWELADRDEARDLLEKLESTPVSGAIREEPTRAAAAKDRFETSSSDLRANARASGVARIGRTVYWGDGTGFMFDAKVIWPDLEPPNPIPLLLTNAHVCSDLEGELTAADGPSIPVEDVKVLFLDRWKGRDSVVVIEYAEVLWSSPRTELDATLLMLRGYPTAARAAKLSESEARSGMLARVIGHPLGGARVFSQAEKVAKVDHRYLYYSTETEPGSSGSPVFDEQWRLIGLHRGHRRAGENYGVRIDRIVEQLRKDLVARFPDGPMV